MQLGNKGATRYHGWEALEYQPILLCLPTLSP